MRTILIPWALIRVTTALCGGVGAALVAATTAAHAAPTMAGNPEAGRAAFSACASCHQVGPSARSRFAPHLNSLIGRRAGTLPDYRYSAAMKRSALVWTEPALRAFIKDPGGTVPGTSMRFFGLGYDDRKITDLLAYLRTFGADGQGRPAAAARS